MPKLLLLGCVAATSLMGCCQDSPSPMLAVVHYRMPGVPLSDEFDHVMESPAVGASLRKFVGVTSEEGPAGSGLGLAVVTTGLEERVVGRWRGFGESAEVAHWLLKRVSEENQLSDAIQQVWSESGSRSLALDLAHRLVRAGAVAEARKTLVRAKEFPRLDAGRRFDGPELAEFVEAEILLAEGEVDSARKLWGHKQSRGVEQRYLAWKFEHELLLAERQPSKAAALLKAALNEADALDNLNREELRFCYGQALNEAGKPHQALHVFDQLSKERPLSVWGIKARHEAAHLREEPHGHSH